MNTEGFLRLRMTRISIGLVVGAAVSAIDHFASGGEVSPIVIVFLLLAASGAAGLIWGRGSWVVTAAVWVWLPCTHLVQHMLGLPDSLYPNTYTSILMLAVFSLVVITAGTGFGILLRRFIQALEIL